MWWDMQDIKYQVLFFPWFVLLFFFLISDVISKSQVFLFSLDNHINQNTSLFFCVIYGTWKIIPCAKLKVQTMHMTILSWAAFTFFYVVSLKKWKFCLNNSHITPNPLILFLGVVNGEWTHHAGGSMPHACFNEVLWSFRNACAFPTSLQKNERQMLWRRKEFKVQGWESYVCLIHFPWRIYFLKYLTSTPWIAFYSSFIVEIMLECTNMPLVS